MKLRDIPGNDNQTKTSPPAATLDRAIGLPLLVLYGLGVTVGAGIYVLVGAAASRAGVHAPIAFLVAAAVMALSAASFAELSVRMPVSAGEAAYVLEGLRSRRLSLLVGLLVIAAGTISAAAISRGAAGYIGVFTSWPDAALVAAVVLAMGAIASWGISQAIGLAAVMTVIELAGLLAIVGAGLWKDPAMVARLPEAWSGLGSVTAWHGILGASLLAFFAFIGFEDMVNVAEEVKSPERNMPLAIAITIGVTTVLYMLVVWVVVDAVPAGDLAASRAPLSLAFERITGAPPHVVTTIAIFATINGVIVQMIMASRVVYGLAHQQSLPGWLGQVNATTRTPVNATILVVATCLLLAVAVPVAQLAELTTRVMLVIFVLVNASLVAVKLRAGQSVRPGFAVPLAIPVLGLVTCVLLVVAGLLV